MSSATDSTPASTTAFTPTVFKFGLAEPRAVEHLWVGRQHDPAATGPRRRRRRREMAIRSTTRRSSATSRFCPSVKFPTGSRTRAPARARPTCRCSSISSHDARRRRDGHQRRVHAAERRRHRACRRTRRCGRCRSAVRSPAQLGWIGGVLRLSGHRRSGRTGADRRAARRSDVSCAKVAGVRRRRDRARERAATARALRGRASTTLGECRHRAESLARRSFRDACSSIARKHPTWRHRHARALPFSPPDRRVAHRDADPRAGPRGARSRGALQHVDESAPVELPFRSIGPASMGGRLDDIEVSLERSERHLHRLRGRRRLQVRRQRRVVQADLPDVRHARRSATSRFIRRIPTSSTSARVSRTIDRRRRSATGIYKSTDGGKTFTNIGLQRRRRSRAS